MATTHPESLGDLFENHREQSYGKIARAVGNLLGRDLSDAGVTLYFRDEISDPDPLIVVALAQHLGIEPEELPASVREKAEKLRQLLSWVAGESNPEPAASGFIYPISRHLVNNASRFPLAA